jgi:hypothetical protein
MTAATEVDSTLAGFASSFSGMLGLGLNRVRDYCGAKLTEDFGPADTWTTHGSASGCIGMERVPVSEPRKSNAHDRRDCFWQRSDKVSCIAGTHTDTKSDWGSCVAGGFRSDSIGRS